jgi:hypothetical protein
LSRGIRRVTTMGTDCHRNTFRQILADGDRIDSYRRMMGWFSNHLLVRPTAGTAWDDRALKEALREGRLYGVFDLLGVPVGFDVYARAGDVVHEMGAEVALAAAPRLHVEIPKLDRPDPKVDAPVISARVLRAVESGWETVTTSATSLDVPLDRAGAFRVEIRIKPRHLRPYLSGYEDVAERELVWIYANPIYVR